MTDPTPSGNPRPTFGKWMCGCGAISASVGCCESCGATRGLVRVEPYEPPDMELLDTVREAVLLSAAHLDLFQRKPSHEKLQAIVNNISDYHLRAIAAQASR